jgi:hypothetical protein
MKPQTKLDRYIEFPQMLRESEKIQQERTITERDKEGPDVILGAKSFLWMANQKEEIDLEQPQLSEKERQSLGKKMAAKIHELSKRGNLYVKYPEDVSRLLAIWAEYKSRKETSSYLIKTFETNPQNIVKLLKCYLPPVKFGEKAPATGIFTMKEYNNLVKVVDTDKVYEALTKLFKFKASKIEDMVTVTPSDRDMANQFMRLHITAKGLNFTQ